MIEQVTVSANANTVPIYRYCSWTDQLIALSNGLWHFLRGI